MTETIQYSVDDQGVALMVIDLKDRPMNVCTEQWLRDLDTCVTQVVKDDAVKGAVVTSGKSTFMAGADLTWLVQMFDPNKTAAEHYEGVKRYSGILRKMETCGKPFAAAINGLALGGGLELALGCHYRVVADNPKIQLGVPEVQVGLLPGAGGTQRIPRLMGIQAGLQTIVQGKPLNPKKALAAGLVHAVVAAEDVVDNARQWVLSDPEPVQPWDQKGFRFPGGVQGAMHPKSVETFMVGSALVAKQTQHNYPAPAAILSCVYEGSIVPIDTGLDIEAKYFATLLADPVARNMTRTLFINKGKADKLARRPKDVERLKVQKLGILGAGMMGAGIAYVSAMAGQAVVLLDTSIESAEKGKAYSEGLLQKRVERGKMPVEKAKTVLDRIHPTTEFDDLAGCDLVIEAVFEDRGIKADVTQKTEAVLGADVIFASNTSTLPITGLAEAHSRPDNFIGLHFFSPVDKMPLVEVIMGEKTSQACLAQALDYVQSIRKTPIVVNDSRGFYTSRVFGVFTNEGMSLLQEGVKPALIENAAKMAGMPVGPLAVMDEVTIELGYKVAKQTKADLGEDYEPRSGEDVLMKFYELERWGKRYGKGFYDYPENGPKRLWKGLSEVYPVAAEQPSVDEVKTRLLYSQAIETVRCMDEGVITTNEDGDIGSIFGWGFPPYTGGTISFIDTVGVRAFVAECDRLAAAYGPRFEAPASLRAKAERDEPFYAAPQQAETRSAA